MSISQKYYILVKFHYHLSSLISVWYCQIGLSLDNIVAVAIGDRCPSFSSALWGEGKSTILISEIWVCGECMPNHSMASHIVYISGLKPDFDPQELLYSLDLGVNIEEVIRHVEAHGNGTVFLAFVDDRSADRCIQVP